MLVMMNKILRSEVATILQFCITLAITKYAFQAVQLLRNPHNIIVEEPIQFTLDTKISKIKEDFQSLRVRCSSRKLS